MCVGVLTYEIKQFSEFEKDFWIEQVPALVGTNLLSERSDRVTNYHTLKYTASNFLVYDYEKLNPF